MREIRTIRISQINIAMESPHSPERYIELFRQAKSIRTPIILRGDEAAILGPMDFKTYKKSGDYISGDIYKFLNIDETAQWFNTIKNEPATEEETSNINIPSELRPNLKIIEFVFHPHNHKLFFINKDRKNTLSPQFAEKFFQQLFDLACEKGKFPAVTVTAIPERESIEEIFSIPTLKKIEITLARPNPDDFEAQERKFLKKLEKQNAKRIETALIALPGKSLEPDEETRLLAQVAASNGKVIGYGLDNQGKRIEESTKDKPMDTPYTVNSGVELSSDVLLRVSRGRIN
ncbi:DUF4747 family protein [Comamonas sp. GB3 AK4-5]|uniref:DUF4747 family protein n=1 Tax=Comamonas sp. GB3 AK4-5 TaxID=3231487 RepID=UPI00351DE676